MRSKLLLARNFALGTVMALGTAVMADAQYARPTLTKGVGLEQKLNSPIPLDLSFHDEANQLVPLRTYFGDKPVVLALVYFNCPSLCPMSLRETVSGLSRLSFEPGKDYQVLVVSFDPKDTAAAAVKAKAIYRAQWKRSGFDAGFHFLTGDQQSIAKLATSVGWQYRWDEPTKQFIHAGGIMVSTPDGRMSRYFYGLQYAPADLRMALVDASQHKIGSPVDYVLLFCFHYDPLTGRYSLVILNVLKIAAGFTILGLGFLLYYLLRDEKKLKAKVSWEGVHHVS